MSLMAFCLSLHVNGELSEEIQGASSRKGAGQIAGRVEDSAGSPVSGAWVMLDSGRISQTSADGAFAFQGLADANYAVKAVAPGMADSLLPKITAASEKGTTLHVVMTNSAAASVIISGCVKDKATGGKVPAVLEIEDSSGPVRWFDVAGTPYGGRTDLPPTLWHQKNKRYWTSGDFAFSARPGRLQISVRSDGYAPVAVSRTLQPSHAESIEIGLEKLFNPADEGWFKGDFHAHGVHGEKCYQVNIPFMAFILRAEQYRWFYLSADFNNDGLITDPSSIAKQEAGEDLYLFLNAEYPKTYGGHIGNLGIAPPKKPLPYPRYSNAEAIKRDIVDQGGVAIAVHPLTGHMKSRELPFIILGAPELLCGFDFYTSWSEQLEKTWAMLLNKGYSLCRTATSDTAFDLGRTPGTMGATFIHPDGGRLSRERIVEAFKKGKTTLSWDGALLLFKIDGTLCGAGFPSGEASRKAAVTLYGTPGAKTVINVTRNSEPFKQFSAAVPKSGRFDVVFELVEREKAWYTATCAIEGHPEKVIAASSPFYFGDWKTPAPVFAQIEARVFDADTKAPVSAEISLVDSGKVSTSFNAKEGKIRLEARVFQRLKATAAGYAPVEVGVLDNAAIHAFISAVSEEDLQRWETYEKAGALLKTLTVDFPLKQK